MFIVCAWCKVHVGEKSPLEDRRTTHGMCSACHGLLSGSTPSIDPGGPIPAQ